MSRVLLAVLAVLLCWRPAAAQEPDKADRATSLATAEKLIATAHGEGIFSAGSWDHGPVVLHNASGLVCRMFSDPRNMLIIYEHPGAPRGIDVSCGLWLEGVYVTTYATPAAALGGFDAAAKDADRSLKGLFLKSEEYPIADPTPPIEGMPKMVVRRYSADFQGRRVFTRVALLDMGDWLIKQRVTAPVEMAEKADSIASVLLNTVAQDMFTRSAKPAPGI